MTAPEQKLGDRPVGPWDFDRETAVQPVAEGRYRTELDSHWNIDTSPNGGYALASLVRAMSYEIDKPDSVPLSITAHYLRPSIADSPAELDIEVLRKGRTTATVRGSSSQDDRVRLAAIGTFGALPTAAHPDDLSIEPPDLPPPDECPIRAELSLGTDLPLLSRVEVRIEPHEVEPGAADRAAVNGWVRFADGRPVDVWALPLFADCFPPSIFSLRGRIGWVPTLELTVHVRRLPESGWLQGSFTTDDASGDLLIEDGTLWDETGAVVARSRQLALGRPVEASAVAMTSSD